MWCRQHHLTVPWRERELFSKEREAKGNLEGEMCVRISTGAGCTLNVASESCGRNTECKEDGEGSEAGTVRADQEVLWFCKKSDLHSVDSKDHGCDPWGQWLLKWPCIYPFHIFSAFRAQAQSEWNWMNRTTGNLKSKAIHSGARGSSSSESSHCWCNVASFLFFKRGCKSTSLCASAKFTNV